MTEETKRVVCRMVAGLVAVDDDFDETERTFIDKVLGQFGVPEEEWDAIFPLLDHDEAEAAIKTLDKSTQKEVFALLTEAAMADGKIVEEERAYLRVVGGAIEMTEQELQECWGS